MELGEAGAHVEWGLEGGLPVCGQTLAYVDRFIELYLARSGNGELQEKVHYYYVSDERFVEEALCREGAAACARDGRVYARSPANLHELAHAIRRRQRAPFGMAYFEEGWAQLFSGAELGWTDDASLIDSLDYVEDRPPSELYDRAGHFLSFVASSRGLDVAERFVDATATVVDEDGLDAASRDVLGASLGAVEAEYATYPRCSNLAWAELLVACSAEPVPWDDAVPELSFPRSILQGNGQFGCDDPAAVGPERGLVWTTFTIDVDEPGTFDLRINVDGTPAETTTELVACDAGCGVDIDFVTSNSDLEESLELDAGRYVIRQSRPFGAPGAIGFLLSLRDR